MAFWALALLLALPTAMTKGDIEQLIIHGSPAKLGEIPFQCTLELLYYGNWYFICGSVIYDKTTMVTAAHCIDNWPAEDLRVTCGNLNLSGPGPNQQIRYVRASFPHEFFSFNSTAGYPNDIGVLKLEEPLQFNKYVNRGKFDVGKDKHMALKNKKVILSGWGYATGCGGISDVLLKLKVPKITNDECDAIWSSYANAPSVNDEHVCFLDDHDSPGTACRGDSGGPAFCDDIIVGITSWGDYNCDGFHPTVYTRVSSYSDWIKEKARQ